ncbi:hypothetical protein GCM10009122_60760 [Fulvivirga kasyanovii]|uniref:Uncharacterized protein n=1 Tax=Fulvivirga kasyanovii TaxID=396812 RepID=A0ABW9RP29_9BACT|nr:hypothetical protein [Fulvivirga kasyanovii]MTI24705.1 hypothetical protein [Fulvivirga kasyanovii]
MSHRKSSSSVILAVAIVILSLLGCSSGSSSGTEATDSLNNVSLKTDELSINKNTNNETKTPEANISDDFAETILEAIDYEFNLVETDQGYDYVKADFNNDGYNDVAAILTKEPNPSSYDFDTEAFIIILTGDKFEQLQQFGYSDNLGGESIKYKDYKKLTWKDETLTYTHQSMRNHMEVDIKFVDIKTKIIDKVSICYYNTSGCKDIFTASEKDTVELIELNKELLNELINP